MFHGIKILYIILDAIRNSNYPLSDIKHLMFKVTSVNKKKKLLTKD